MADIATVTLELEVLKNKFKEFIDGSDTDTVTTDGGVRDSIAKAIKDAIDAGLLTGGSMTGADIAAALFGEDGVNNFTTAEKTKLGTLAALTASTIATALTTQTGGMDADEVGTALQKGAESVAKSDAVLRKDTIADLRALEPDFDGQVVNVSGHTVQGIGGGTFIADFSSDDLDDNGFTVVTVGEKRWVRRLSGFVTPEMIGALETSTDNSVEIINCFSKNLPVILDSTLAITNDIILSGVDVSLSGRGRLTTGNNNRISVTSGMVNISDVTIEGGQIYAIDCPSVMVKYVKFVGGTFYNAHVTIQGLSDSVVVRNCSHINASYPGEQSTAGGASFWVSSGAHIKKLTLTDNKSENSNSSSTYHFFTSIIDFVDISNNEFDTSYSTAIRFYNCAGELNGKIHGNFISKVGFMRPLGSSGSGTNGIYTNTATNISVKQNTIIDVAENGIEGTFSEISDNFIENTGADLVNWPTPSPEGIYPVDTKIVRANIIRNSKGHGIRVYKSDNIVSDLFIANNHVFYPSEIPLSRGVDINVANANSAVISNIRLHGNTVENCERCVALPTNVSLTSNISLYSNTGGRLGNLIPYRGLSANNSPNETVVFFNQDFKEWPGSAPDGWTLKDMTVAKESIFGVDCPIVTRADANSSWDGGLRQIIAPQGYPTIIEVTYKTNNTLRVSVDTLDEAGVSSGLYELTPSGAQDVWLTYSFSVPTESLGVRVSFSPERYGSPAGTLVIRSIKTYAG